MRRDRDKSHDDLVNEAILYLCAFVVSATGVWAVMVVVQNENMAGAFTLALMAGFAVSLFARRYHRLHRYALGWSVGLAAIACLWFAVTGRFLGQPLSALIAGNRQLGLGVVLAGLVIVRSFGLVRVEDLLFCVVPSLAIFGLIGSEGLGLGFTALFLVFVFASAYLAGQAHLMAQFERGRAAPGQDVRRMARERLAVLAVLFVVSVGAAVPTARAAAVLIPGYEPPAATDEEERQGGGGRGGTVPTGRPLWTSADSLAVGVGPIQLGTRIVMRVKCQESFYWRAASLSYYTGNSWQAQAELPAQIAPNAEGSFDLRHLVNAQPGRVVKQEFEFEDASSQLVFAVMQPLELRLGPGALRRGAVEADAAGSLTVADGNLEPNATYEVRSQVDNLQPVAGAASVLGTSDPQLLQIPHSARQVHEFARAAVGDITRPQAQIAAIVSYLQTRASYGPNAPPTPPGEDAVVFFLSASQTGYCDLFASAAALMCRALGIPARVAVGYSTGTYDSAEGVYVVREQDAHAWVEAYLPDQGWVVVDATPADDEVTAPAPTEKRGWLARAWRVARRNALYLVAALALLAWGMLTAKARWLDDYLALRRRERSLGLHDHRGAIIFSYERLVRALAKRGYGRRDWETPNEYARRLGRGAYLAALMPAVNALTADYLLARFSERTLARKQAQRARQAVEDVRQGLRRLKNMR